MQLLPRVLWVLLSLALTLPAAPQSIRISEIMAAGSAAPLDEDGESPDWVEILNSGPEAASLEGWFLTDDSRDLAKWRFPATNLLANSRLVVFASGKNRSLPGAPLHTNFRLAASGGDVLLVPPNSLTAADRLTYPLQRPGFSFGVECGVDPVPIIGPQSPGRVHVPDRELDRQWFGAEEPFDDQNWDPATSSVGFDKSGGSSAGLVAWWNFDEATNPSTALDVSGANHHCTLVGGPRFTEDAGGRTGRAGDRALKCGGAGYGSVADAEAGMFDTATAHNAISISLWVFGDSSLPQNTSIFYGGGNSDGSGTRSLNAHLPWGDSVIYWDTAGCCDPGQERIFVSEPDSTRWKGRWNHYVFIKRGNLKEIWQNGTLLHQDVNAAELTQIRSFYVGSFMQSLGYRGLIDDFAVWDFALAKAQIEALAAGATPGTIDRLDSLFNTDISASMFNRNSSMYLRAPFSWPGAPTPERLVLRVNYDDGFFCWLNGVAVASRNAPASPTYNAAAATNRPAQSARRTEEIDLSQGISLLRPGANLLAFQGLNAAASDEEFLLSFELRAGRPCTTAFFASPTPGAPNGSGTAGIANNPKLSPSGGLYLEPLDVLITTETPGAVLVYTTDGSNPSLSNGVVAFETNTTVRISKTQVLRAAAFRAGFEASLTSSGSYIITDQVAGQSRPSTIGSTWPGGYPADFGMDARIITNALPGYGLVAGLLDLPSVAVVMAPEDLWDHQTGIYANSTVEMERIGSVEMLFPDGQTGFQHNAGVVLRGNSSAFKEMTPKHSFTINFRGSFGTPKLNFPVFPDTSVTEFNSLVLRANALDSWVNSEVPWNHDIDGELRWYRTRASYIRNQWMNDALHDLGQPAAHGRFVHLFLNGYYWGIYNLLERLDEHYAASHLGGTAADYDVLHDQELKSGDLDAWNQLMSRAGADLSSDANYQRLMGNNADGSRNPIYPVLVDLTNLVDYMILHIYAGADDWPWHNWSALRRRGSGSTGFKFLAWDQEISINSLVKQHTDLGQFYAEVNVPNCAAFVYSRCRANAEFRQFFADRVQRHLFNAGALSVSNNTARYDARVAEIDHAIVAESARWGDFYRPSKPYRREAEWLGTNQWMREVFFPSNHFVALRRFRTARLFPILSAPEFNAPGGMVPFGFGLTITNPNAVGTVYYAADGLDPRQRGGGIEPLAVAYSSPLEIRAPTLVKARVLSGGQWSALMEGLFYPPQDFTRLVVSELMYDPPDMGGVNGSELEFVEFKNTGTNTLDLSGVTLGGGVTFTFPNGSSVQPNGFVLLVRNPAAFTNAYPGAAPDGTYSGKLENGGELLVLRDRAGHEVWTCAYGSDPPWPLTPHGLGFSLVPNELAPAEPTKANRWRASTNPGGSPGDDDPPARILSVEINEVLTNPAGSDEDAIELFNPNAEPVDISGWLLTDDPGVPKKFIVPPDTELPAHGLVTFYARQFNPAPDLETSFGLSADGESVCLYSADAAGRLTGFSDSVSFGAAAPGTTFGRFVNGAGEEQFPAQSSTTLGATNVGPLVGPLVITEILEEGSSGLAGFIELKNISQSAVDLFDPQRPANTWRVAGLNSNLPQGLSLTGGGLLLLVQTNPATFRTQYNIPSDISIVGPYSRDPGVADAPLVLQRPGRPSSGVVPYIDVDVIDRSSPAWPRLANGLSFQKFTPPEYGNDPHNWRLAAPTPGAEFVSADTDGDGLPDHWEVAHGLDPFAPDADADPDDDGQTNAQEYLAGTDPRDPSDRLELRNVGIVPSAEGFFLSFEFLLRSNRAYSVVMSSDLKTSEWLPVAQIPAENTSRWVSVKQPLSADSRWAFFRVVGNRVQ